jgi:hypothetical protein
MSQFFTPLVIVLMTPLWVAILAGIFTFTFGRRIAREDRAERIAREAARTAAFEEMLRRVVAAAFANRPPPTG